MPVVTMRELLEAGVHFGHHTRRWNPKMKKYIFGQRNGIYIIDLHKTQKLLEQAYNFVREVAEQGGTVLFVGTKRQAQETIMEAAQKCSMFYVTHRWLGGMLTNFNTIRSRVERMKQLRQMTAKDQDGKSLLDLLPKKEAQKLRDELARLERNLSGIENMTDLPKALFVVDVRREETAIREASRLGIPIIGIVDTNCDPELVDYPIPGNDDAIRALRLISNKIADAVLEGLKIRQAQMEGIEVPAEVTAAEPAVEEEEVSMEEVLSKVVEEQWEVAAEKLGAVAMPEEEEEAVGEEAMVEEEREAGEEPALSDEPSPSVSAREEDWTPEEMEEGEQA